MSLIFYLLPTVYTVREFLPLRQERTRDLLLSVISEHRAFVCHFLSALLQSFITLTAVFGAFSVLIDIPHHIHRFYPILFCLYAMWTFVLCALTAVGFLIGKKLPVSLILALLLPCVGFPVLSIYRGRWDNAPAAYSIMADYLDPRSIRTNDLPSTLALRQTFGSFMVSLALHLVFSILLLVALWFILKWRGRSVDSASPKV